MRTPILAALAVLALALLPSVSQALVTTSPLLALTEYGGTLFWLGWIDDTHFLTLTAEQEGNMHILNLTLYEISSPDGYAITVVDHLAVNQRSTYYGSDDVSVSWDPPLLAVSVVGPMENRLIIVDVSAWSIVLDKKTPSPPGVSACCGVVLVYWDAGSLWRLEAYSNEGDPLWGRNYSSPVTWASAQHGLALAIIGGDQLHIYNLATGNLVGSVTGGELGLYSIDYANITADGRFLLAAYKYYNSYTRLAVYDLENSTVVLQHDIIAKESNLPRWLDNRTLIAPVTSGLDGIKYKITRLYWEGGWTNTTVASPTGPGTILRATLHSLALSGDTLVKLVNLTGGAEARIYTGIGHPISTINYATLSPTGRYLLLADWQRIGLYLTTRVHMTTSVPMRLELPQHNITVTLGEASLWTDEPGIPALLTPLQDPPCIGDPPNATINVTLKARPVGGIEVNATLLYMNSTCGILEITGAPQDSQALINWPGGTVTLPLREGSLRAWFSPGSYTIRLIAPPPRDCLGCTEDLTLWESNITATPGNTTSIMLQGYESALGRLTVAASDYMVTVEINESVIGGPLGGVRTWWAVPGTYSVVLVAQPPEGVYLLWPSNKSLIALKRTVTIGAGGNVTLQAPSLVEAFPIVVVKPRIGYVEKLILTHEELGENITIPGPGGMVIAYPGRMVVSASFARLSDPLTPGEPLEVASLSLDGPGSYSVVISEEELVATIILYPVKIGGLELPARYTLDNLGASLTVNVGDAPIERRIIASPGGSTVRVSVEPLPAGDIIMPGGLTPANAAILVRGGRTVELDNITLPAVIVWLGLEGFNNGGTLQLEGPWGSTTFTITEVQGRPLVLPPDEGTVLKYEIASSPGMLPWVHTGTISLPGEPGTYNISIPGLAQLRIEGSGEVRVTGPDGKSVTLQLDGPLTLLVPPGKYTVSKVVEGVASLVLQPRTETVSLAPGEAASVTPSLQLNTWGLLGLAIIAVGLAQGARAKRKRAPPPPPPPRGKNTLLIPASESKSVTPPPRPEPEKPEPKAVTPKWKSGLPEGLDRLYKPLELLGRGGFGLVWKVQVRGTGEVCALKHPDPAARRDRRVWERLKERFIDEAAIWRSVRDHENIVYLCKADFEPFPHLLIEYMEGIRAGDRTLRSLRDLIRYYSENGQHVPPRTAAWITLQVARGLDYAHRKGVTHLDIKPENILLRGTLERPTAKITDWGIAKLTGQLGAKSIPGYTPQYSAPEVIRRLQGDTSATPTSKSDIYSLGIVLREMLGLLDEPKPTLAPGTLEYELARLAEEMTRPNPQERPDASKVVKRLENLLSGNRGHPGLR